MTAKAIVWDGSFGDTTLPKISLSYVPPLPNSLYQWTAEGLELGPLTQWVSGISGEPLVADAGVPEVVDTSAGRVVKFDGVDDRMRAAFTYSGSRTWVAVYRLTNPQGGDAPIFGRSGFDSGAFMTASVGTYMAARSGSSEYIRTDPDVVPDTSWHVVVMSIIGTSAAVQHDNAEATGNLPLVAMQGLALGYNPYSSTNRTAVEYKHVEILAGGLQKAQRHGIVNLLAARYGITL